MAEILDQTTTEKPINPTSSTNRILHLDIFRGFAILGIFMVNILVMNTSFLYRESWIIENASAINDAAYWCLEMFFFSKFFPIFSFLFGIGVALQIRSLKAKMSNSNLFLFRRFTGLLIFGVAHLLLLWAGDILHLYALFGFVLMFMYRTPPYVILIAAIAVMFFPYFDEIYQYIIDCFNVNPAGDYSVFERWEISDLKINGSYASGIDLRISEYGFFMPFLVSFLIPTALTMTLLGLYIVKKGIIDRIDSFVNKIRIPFIIVFVVLISYRFTLVHWIMPAFQIEYGTMLSFVLMTIFILTEVVLSFAYLIIIVHLIRSKIGLKLLSPLQYVGRMAFTNYIMQSVIGYLIMRTFGYFESFSPAECIMIVLIVFACQIPLSWFWLKHFKFGPLEWLWRCISYWKILPIRK